MTKQGDFQGQASKTDIMPILQMRKMTLGDDVAFSW